MSELLVSKGLNPSEVFTVKGIQPVIDKIKEKVEKFEPNLETVTSRKAIASMANKVAKSKTYLDGLGKDFVADIKAQAKIVDQSRKHFRDEMDTLKEKVRRPLTEWEDAEKKKQEEIESKIKLITKLATVNNEWGEPLCLEQLENNLTQVNFIAIDDSFGDLEKMALDKKAQTVAILERFIAKAKEALEKEKELARLKKAEEERIAKEQEKLRQQKEQEERERIIREAREKAEQEAREREAEIVRQKEEAEQRARDAEAKAEQDKKDAAKREEDRKAKEEEIRIQNEEKRRREIEAAKEEERRLIEIEKAKKLAEEKEREDNKKHRHEVLNGIAEQITQKTGLSLEDVQKVVKIIALKEINNIEIKF